MRRPPFRGLAVSVLFHGALVLAVALVVPRAELLSPLFIDLTEAAGERSAGVRVSEAPARAVPVPSRQRGSRASPKPAGPPPASREAVAPPATVDPSPPAESSRPPAPSAPASETPAVVPTPPSGERPGIAPPAPRVSPAGETTASAGESSGALDGSTIYGDRPDREPGEGGAAAALAGGEDAGVGIRPGSELALALPGTGAGGPGAAYAGYLADLRRRIQESLRYPAAARRRGVAGTVTLELTILPSGAIGAVSVIQSSAHALLDEAAVETVRGLHAHPFPAGLPARTLTVRLPVVFALR